MHFSGELELHDAMRRPDSVGYFLQFRQILPPDHASVIEPAREPAGRTARRGVLRASSGRVGVDWVVSYRPRGGCLPWPLLIGLGNRPNRSPDGCGPIGENIL